MEFNKFDKVKVSTTATGLGDWLEGGLTIFMSLQEKHLFR